MNKISNIRHQTSDIPQGPLIAIVGQTASGKSALALEIAQNIGGEIISADSWAVRRELDIATAKPSRQEQALTPHHLIDIVSPCDDFTAVEFQRQCYEAIYGINIRGNMPILVGGTGLYIDSVLYNYSFSPKKPAELRATYNDMTINELLTEAKERNLDTSQIDTRNKRRIIRLLETDGHQPTKQPLRDNTCLIGLQVGRADLHARIERRVDTMLAQGLEDEVKQLSEKYGWECEGLKGIGYIEWQDYFLGSQSLEQTRLRIIQSTNQLAKRQQTWFKRNRDIIWCASQAEALQKMYTFLGKS